MNYRINHVFGMFENRFEILEIENFEMKLKFENFELRIWKLNF